MWEGKTPQHENNIAVNKAVLGRLGYIRPQNRSGMPPGKNASVKSNICWMRAKFCPKYLFCCANRPCRRQTLLSGGRKRLFTFLVGRFFRCSYVSRKDKMGRYKWVGRTKSQIHKYRPKTCKMQQAWITWMNANHPRDTKTHNTWRRAREVHTPPFVPRVVNLCRSFFPLLHFGKTFCFGVISVDPICLAPIFLPRRETVVQVRRVAYEFLI
jgi:hypothetical protein